jgi:cell division septal protein FtsQ
MRNYRKPYRVKRKRLILRNRFFWLGLLFLVVAGATFYFLFFSEFFQVEKVVVTGEEKISKEEIKTLIPQKNIFLTDLKKIRENILKKFPQIAEVEINRGLPDVLNVQVSERVAVAVWCEQDCFLIDREGVVFEIAPLETDLVKIFGEKKLFGKDKISQILEIKSKLKENLDIGIKKASLVSPKRLNVETTENWEIYFNLERDLDWQITKLGLVLEKQIPPEKRRNLQYIDLRFSRIYYK